MQGNPSPVSRILSLVKMEQKEITAIYFYAIMNGLILLVIPIGIQSLIAFAQTTTFSASITVLIVLIVVSVFMAGVLQIKQMQVIEKIQQKIFVRYAFLITKKIPTYKLSAVDNYYLPELMNRFFDVGTLQKGLAKLLLDFPIAIIQILFGLILLSFYHPVFIVFGTILILLIWGILFFSGTKGLQYSIMESTHKYEVAGLFEEMSNLFRTVKYARTSDFFLNKTDDRVVKYLDARTGHFRILLLQFKTLVAFKTIVTTAMLIVGIILLLKQQLNVGQFIAAEIVLLTIINSVEKLISNLDSVYDVLTAVEKIALITDKETEQGGSMQLDSNASGLSIRMQNVSFQYPHAEKTVIKNLNLNIAPGEVICVRGEEGAGKSTLLRLMAGSYDNFEGAILINDFPIANYNPESLRMKTGILISQQDIFNGTLMENICFGVEPDSMKTFKHLSEITGLHAYVEALPKGYETNLASTGRKLPEHAVKKILLMRALINKPALLLLEEPWLGFELGIANQIKEYLLQSLPNTTVVVFTNDPDFERNCTQTIHLSNN